MIPFFRENTPHAPDAFPEIATGFGASGRDTRRRLARGANGGKLSDIQPGMMG